MSVLGILHSAASTNLRMPLFALEDGSGELCLSAVHLLGLGTLAYGGHRFCKGAANAGLKHLAIGHQTVLVDTSIPLFSVF